MHAESDMYTVTLLGASGRNILYTAVETMDKTYLFKSSPEQTLRRELDGALLPVNTNGWRSLRIIGSDDNHYLPFFSNGVPFETNIVMARYMDRATKGEAPVHPIFDAMFEGVDKHQLTLESRIGLPQDVIRMPTVAQVFSNAVALRGRRSYVASDYWEKQAEYHRAQEVKQLIETRMEGIATLTLLNCTNRHTTYLLKHPADPNRSRAEFITVDCNAKVRRLSFPNVNVQLRHGEKYTYAVSVPLNPSRTSPAVIDVAMEEPVSMAVTRQELNQLVVGQSISGSQKNTLGDIHEQLRLLVREYLPISLRKDMLLPDDEHLPIMPLRKLYKKAKQVPRKHSVNATMTHKLIR